MMNSLEIAGVPIAVNKDGLYRLNDLHQAAGGEVRHKPANWMQTQQFKELEQTLIDDGNPSSVKPSPTRIMKGGSAQGTYVCKELVYAYAMWVSAAFHLHVIRTFDAHVIQAENERRQKMIARAEARAEFFPLTDELKASREAVGKETKAHHYSNEADLINRIVLGMPAKQFKLENGFSVDTPTRDILTAGQIAAVKDLQRADLVFMQMGLTFQERKEQLTQLFERKHRQALIDEVLRIEA
ncbi:KilA-N domain-containing protein [Salmonella enterica]|nr:KilA-N domain-containing protein [Salmonella enterica]